MTSSHGALTYHPDGLAAATIGDHQGLTPADLDAFITEMEAARAAIVAAHDDGMLGFLDAPLEDITELEAWAKRVRQSERFDTQIVVGIGGSSLGALAILASAGAPLDGLDTHFAENIDPHGFARLLGEVDLERTLITVITKSGSTIETMSKFWILYDRLVDRLGAEGAAEHVVAITDPNSSALKEMAEARGFTTFAIPPNVGGRFSVLTPVGLVPLALAGYDTSALLEGARCARAHFLDAGPMANAPMLAAAHQVLLLERGVTQVVMMAYCDRLLPMVDWFRQLWAESLGKRTRRDGEEVFTGITPIKALGAIDQHSQVQLYMEGPRDKHVVFLEVADHGVDVRVPTTKGLPDKLGHLQGKGLSALLRAELEGTQAALGAAERPTSRWTFASVSPASVGAFIVTWEVATAVAGELLDINAYDQPGVELGKKIAHGRLGRADLVDFAETFATDEEVAAAGFAPVAATATGQDK